MAAGFSKAQGPQLRVGHAEREEVAAQLREHYASGRLTLDELHERLDAALAAKTRADLDALLTDLPPGGPSTGTRSGPDQGTRPLADSGPGWNRGGGWDAGRRAGSAVAAMAWSALMMCALLTVGFLGVVGVGVGRPFGIVLLLAGLAFMRRILFGRRRYRHHCGRGPRPRRRW